MRQTLSRSANVGLSSSFCGVTATCVIATGLAVVTPFFSVPSLGASSPLFSAFITTPLDAARSTYSFTDPRRLPQLRGLSPTTRSTGGDVASTAQTEHTDWSFALLANNPMALAPPTVVRAVETSSSTPAPAHVPTEFVPTESAVSISKPVMAEAAVTEPAAALTLGDLVDADPAKPRS